MPNPRYLAGRRAEYAIVKAYRDAGWNAVRTAGSHGLFDVIAIGGPPLKGTNKTPHWWWHEIHLIQVKRTRREVVKYTDKNVRALQELTVPEQVRKFLVVWKHGKGWDLALALDGLSFPDYGPVTSLIKSETSSAVGNISH